MVTCMFTFNVHVVSLSCSYDRSDDACLQTTIANIPNVQSRPLFMGEAYLMTKSEPVQEQVIIK